MVAGALVCLLGGLLAAAWPGSADSAQLRVTVLGRTQATPPPSCPGKIVNNVEVVPCRVEGRVTGFQVKADGVANPYVAPFDGKIVAWTITLSRPSNRDTRVRTDEVGFFNDFLGEPSKARIAVLRRIPRSRPPRYRLLRQSPVQVLNRHFGRTAVFALAHPLPILRGQVVALTIPTWAPMFAFNIGEENTWRGSRPPRKCASKADIKNGHPQMRRRTIRTYGCYYSNARLLYTAILVKKPEEPGGGRSRGSR